MANPVGCILHSRFILADSTDRSGRYTFGITTSFQTIPGGLATPSGADLTFLTNSLLAFINGTAGTQVNPLAWYLGPQCSRGANASEIVQYDISNALGLHELAGAPYNVQPFTLGDHWSGNPWPEQVAQTIAWRAAYGSDPEFGTHTRPRADDRNRMYLGPLMANVAGLDTETPGRMAFNTSFLNDVSEATRGLAGALVDYDPGVKNWQVVAWSRKLAAIKEAFEFSQQLYPTTQRRRVSKRPNLVWTPLV